MNGILLVDKPSGMSSYDVIRRLKKILTTVKIGHAGTLDPLASGLLIILIGSATKQASTFLKLDKAYEAEITLGANSTTDDAEGEIFEVSEREPGKAEVKETLKKFQGEISQVPPQHSAIKVGGQRAYHSARKGQVVDLKARGVTIHDLKLVSYKYPLLKLNTRVSSGTYIRSLARDIGQQLGTGCYLSKLRRTSIGDYSIKASQPLAALNKSNIEQNIIRVQ